MQLATTAQTLDFLQDAYTQFRTYTPEQQAQALEFNELVRAPLEQPDLPLRVLYIDLLMHDEMIRHSQAARDTQKTRIERLIRNKVVLQGIIRRREQVQEAVTPDPRTEEPHTELVTLLAWWPEPDRAAFQKQLQPLWQRWQRGKLSAPELLAAVLQRCVVLGCRSVVAFRALFSLVEWLVFHHGP